MPGGRYAAACRNRESYRPAHYHRLRLTAEDAIRRHIPTWGFQWLEEAKMTA
jgi:hypothetical protein